MGGGRRPLGREAIIVELEGEDSGGWRVEGSGAREWRLVGQEGGCRRPLRREAIKVELE